MAVVLKHEELERPDEQSRKLRLIPGKQGQAAGTATTEMEYPYYDLYQMYDYITRELGIK